MPVSAFIDCPDFALSWQLCTLEITCSIGLLTLKEHIFIYMARIGLYYPEGGRSLWLDQLDNLHFFYLFFLQKVLERFNILLSVSVHCEIDRSGNLQTQTSHSQPLFICQSRPIKTLYLYPVFSFYVISPLFPTAPFTNPLFSSIVAGLLSPSHTSSLLDPVSLPCCCSHSSSCFSELILSLVVDNFLERWYNWTEEGVRSP